MNTNFKLPALVFGLLGGSALTTAISLRAQSATATTDGAATAQNLAKYDKNHNGKLDPDELAAMQAFETKAAKAPVVAGPGGRLDDDTVTLSPFEVREANNGYYATNTMSGTRLNTKIEDLGSAISVVTKQQIADFAMLDINDIFNYEANTEGTGNFTDVTIDRNGMVTDNIQNNPQGANRIRGVGPANLALNNFATSGRVPVDPISIDSVEISRGPNSNIFGLGGGAGTVNLIAASAALNHQTTTAVVRMDSLGGYRTSLDVNRPLIKGKVALRASVVYQHDGYNEKPSGATTRRLNFMLRAQPFKNTSVRASFQAYDFYGTRANTITPRDAVSYWKSLGSPTWDPIAAAVTINGVTTFTGSGIPNGLGGQNFSNPILFVDGGIQLWEISRMPAATATNGPNNTAGVNRMLETVASPIRTGRPLYATVPGIADKAIFDWSSINLAGPNSIKDHNEMTTVELEQYFLNTERQVLAVQVGWNREHATNFNKNIVGQSSSQGNSNYVYVDVNSKLLDGRANPYFRRPYLGAGQSAFSSNPYLRDTFRGQTAYKLDFTAASNWEKWLGRHSLVGYAEEKQSKTYSYRFRAANLTRNPVYAPAGTAANQGITPVVPFAMQTYNHYYVGDNIGQNIDYAPSAYKNGAYTFNWFNPQSNQWVAEPVTLGDMGVSDSTAGTYGLETLLKTRGVVLQSAMLGGRVVLTGGKRHDENYGKFQKNFAFLGTGLTVDTNTQFDYPAMDGFVSPWAMNKGDTTTKGLVVKPFRGWSNIDRATASGGVIGFFAGLLRGFDMHYNTSDSFAPESPGIAVTMEVLPNPSANGKDYGFSLSLWNDKLVLRANRYTTSQINSRNGQYGTFGQRVLNMDIVKFTGSNAVNLQRQARNWVTAANPTFTVQQVEDAVYKIMGLTAEQVLSLNSTSIAETQDVTAKGDELELSFNPDRFWTLKFNATRTQSIDANMAPHIPAWIAQRMPIWLAAIDTRVNAPWFTTGYNGDTPTAIPTASALSPQSYLSGTVQAPLNLGIATQGKSRPQIREWHFNSSASVRLAKYTEQRILKNISVGGSLRWESQGAIGYYGIPINGDITIATAFDPNRPIYVKANTYVDAFVTYNTRLFHDKVRARFQLNARNLQEWKTHLTPVAAYPDGSPNTYRIIEPVSFIFTTTFDL